MSKSSWSAFLIHGNSNFVNPSTSLEMRFNRAFACSKSKISYKYCSRFWGTSSIKPRRSSGLSWELYFQISSFKLVTIFIFTSSFSCFCLFKLNKSWSLASSSVSISNKFYFCESSILLKMFFQLIFCYRECQVSNKKLFHSIIFLLFIFFFIILFFRICNFFFSFRLSSRAFFGFLFSLFLWSFFFWRIRVGIFFSLRLSSWWLFRSSDHLFWSFLFTIIRIRGIFLLSFFFRLLCIKWRFFGSFFLWFNFHRFTRIIWIWWYIFLFIFLLCWFFLFFRAWAFRFATVLLFYRSLLRLRFLSSRLFIFRAGAFWFTFFLFFSSFLCLWFSLYFYIWFSWRRAAIFFNLLSFLSFITINCLLLCSNRFFNFAIRWVVRINLRLNLFLFFIFFLWLSSFLAAFTCSRRGSSSLS